MIKSGPSHTAQESAPTIQPTTSANLPLRQSRQHVGGTQPKIHDVTEKFTRACNGMRNDQKVDGDGCGGGAWRGYPTSIVMSFPTNHHHLEMKKLNLANSEKLSQLSRSVNSSKMNILRFLNPLGLSKYVLANASFNPHSSSFLQYTHICQ